MITIDDLDIGKQILCYSHGDGGLSTFVDKWRGRIYTVKRHVAEYGYIAYECHCDKWRQDIIWSLEDFIGETACISHIKFLSFSRLDKASQSHYLEHSVLPDIEIFNLRLLGYDI